MNDHKLPLGWRWAKVGEAVDKRQYGLNLLASSDGNIPIIGMKDLIDGRICSTDLARVTMSEADAARYLLQEGDILLNRTNSADLVGKIGYVNKPLYAVFASYLVRLTPNRSVADPKFLAIWLSSPGGQAEIRPLITRGVSQANINPTWFCRRVALPLPQLAEQRRIVDILATWDRAIDALTSLIRKIEWVNAARLSAAVARCQSTRSAPLRVLAVVQMGHSPPSKSYNALGAGLPLVQGAGDLVNEVFVPRTWTTQPTVRVSGSTIVMTVRAPVGELGWCNVPACLGRGVCALHPRDNCDPDFLFHFLRLNRVLWTGVGQGSMFEAVNKSAIESLQLQVPTHPDEQRAIGALGRTIDSELQLLESSLTHFKLQRRALVSELLTGRLRVGDAERFSADVS